MRRRALALLLLTCGAAARAEEYRMGDYRAPVPESVPGGRTITTAEAQALHAEGSAVWIDVLPAPRRPEGLPSGSLWRPSPHHGIPGSLWLPDVGQGALATATEAWFRRMLEQATHGDTSRPIIFYCLADCWMSWNAAKRAAALGYRAVHWYPDGADGWEMAGLPTEILQPAPGPP
jgi:PQQ-dependent catabolism-associated CXXCW motif protein